MLGVSNETGLSELVWRTLASRVEIPAEVEVTQHVFDGVKLDCQRRYTRKAVQSPAIAALGSDYHACLMKDISRIGVGFYSPVNMLPKKAVRLWLPNGNIFQVRVTRCRRLAERCYEVGTRFVGAS